MRSFIVVVLALLALGGAAFLLRMDSGPAQTGGAEGTAPLPAAPSRAPAEIEPLPEVSMETPPEMKPKVSKKPEPRPAKTPKVQTPRPKPAQPGGVTTSVGGATSFQQKYADQSLQDLNRASRTVYSEHRDAIQKLMEQRYANAFYDSYPYEYDVDGNRLEASDVIPQPAAGEYRIRQVFEDAAVDEWRLVELPPSEFPDLYERYYEWQWLEAEIKEREGAKPR